MPESPYRTTRTVPPTPTVAARSGGHGVASGGNGSILLGLPPVLAPIAMLVQQLSPADQRRLFDALGPELGFRVVSIDMQVQPSADIQPDMWDKAKTAKYLGISIPTLNRLHTEGRIKHVQVGSRVLFDPADVQNYVRRCKGAGVQLHRPGRPPKKCAAAGVEPGRESEVS